MNDKTRRWFGMACFTAECSLENLINCARSASIELYQIEQKGKECFFFTPVDQLKKAKSVLPNASFSHVTGLFGFLFSEMKRPFHWFLLCWALLLFVWLNHTIYSVRWQSTNWQMQSRLQHYLETNGIKSGMLVLDDDFDETLKDELKHAFVHELSWIEVQRSGSLLKISFTHKVTPSSESFNRYPLISFKDAMVVRFDVLHGMKVVQKYQIVSKGDVLVEPYLIDSRGQTQQLFASGRVYGLTWYTVTSELDNKTRIDVLDFLRLLGDCRKQIECEIDQDEEIVKENILQLSLSEGTIRMIIHYTCLEDITKQ